MSITVVIANYNYTQYLAQAIDSVLSQCYLKREVIVVDDCSADREAVEQIKCLYTGVKWVIRDKNVGIVENFNDILFNHVKTDKVMYLGADNWLRPDALLEMRLNETDICSSDIALVGTETDEFRKGLNTEYLNGYYVWRFMDGNINEGNFIHGSSLYDVELAKKVGGYERNPDSQKTEEDWMLWKKMIQEGATYSHVKEPLLYYRRHKTNFQK